MAYNDDTCALNTPRGAGENITSCDTQFELAEMSELLFLNLGFLDDLTSSTMKKLEEEEGFMYPDQKFMLTKVAISAGSFLHHAAPSTTYRASELKCLQRVNSQLPLRSIDVPYLLDFLAVALCIAISRGYDLVVKRILTLPDIDINTRRARDQSPLEMALKNQQYYIFQLLLADPRTKINQKNKLGQTLLHHAVEYRDLVAVQMLLAHDEIDVNCLNAEGDDALLLAVATYEEYLPGIGLLPIIERLISTPSINVNQQDSDGRSALWHAVDFGHKRLVEIFTRADHVDWNLPDHQGFTPLARAAENGNLHMAGLLLLQSRVCVNAGLRRVVPPLWVACRAGQESIVSLLLDHNSININEKSPEGTSSLQVALTMHHLPIVRLLLDQEGKLAINDQGPQCWTALIFAAAGGFCCAIDRLLAFPGIDIHSVDDCGRAALWWAAAGGHTECVKLLIKQPRLDVAARDFNHKSAMDVAKERGHWDTVGPLQAAAMWYFLLWTLCRR
ncbi:hypothetical protein N7448_011204 [Penicillium atrosanguineum]|nr:hypothetical protein N7448_011204 [Penicillium atrosanguineum]